MPVQVDRAVADAAAARRCPDSSRRLAQRRGREASRRRARSGRRAAPRSRPCGAASAAPARRPASSTSALAVRWAGTQLRSSPSSWACRCSTYAVRSRSWSSSGAAQPVEHPRRASACRPLVTGSVGAAGRRLACRRARTGPAGAEPRAGGEAGRVVEVVGGRQQVGVRPHGLAAVLAALGEHRPPQRGRVAQPPRPQLEPDQRGEGLPRPARRWPGAGARSRAARRRPAGAGWRRRRPPRRPSPRPARARSPAGPAPAFCSGVSSGSNRPPVSACCSDSGLDGSMRADRLLEPRGVDGDAARVGRDRVDQVRAQPRHVREQPLVRRLAQREVEPHLVGRHLEARAERGRRWPAAAPPCRRTRAAARRRSSRPPPGPARRAPGRSGCRTSRRRCCASSAAAGRHQRGRLLGHRAELGHRAALAGEHRAHRVDDLAGDRVDQLAPRRQRRLDPLGAAPGLDRRRRAGREAQASSSQSSASRIASSTCSRSAVADRAVAGRRDGLPGHVAGQVPVDRAALVGQQLRRAAEKAAPMSPPPRRSAPRSGSTGWSGPPAPEPVPLVVVRRARVEPEGKVAHVSPHVVARSGGACGRSGRWCRPARAAELAGWAHHDRCASHRIDRVL